MFARRFLDLLPFAVALATIVVCGCMIDLKGISSDEGFRLGIMNGGRPAQLHPGSPWATWAEVIQTVNPHAYQPGYYLLQNSLMRLAGRQDLLFFRYLNIGCLAIALAGLLALSRNWTTWPRTFALALFCANAYLFMHVLQVREYVAALAIYIWGTWLVLRLDRRHLADEWADIGHFVAYGLLLVGGFYIQTWTVFPAVAQGAFLVFHRRPQYGRFLAHLGLSYLVVFTLTWPYLHGHQQKVDVGLWERAQVTLSGQLHQGFQLILSGHLPHTDYFSDALPWLWLGLLTIAAWCWWRRRATLPAALGADTGRLAWLLALSIAVPLAFQIGYFYKVEPLSVWPRYFIVHYFFLIWLIALGFQSIHAGGWLTPWRKVALIGLTGCSGVLAYAAVYQVRSFYRDPYFDTGFSADSDWRVGTQLLAGVLAPSDCILTRDFITRSTQSFTHPTANRYLDLATVTAADLTGVARIVYLEETSVAPQRAEIVAKFAARGFGPATMLAESGGSSPYWRVFAFDRLRGPPNH